MRCTIQFLPFERSLDIDLDDDPEAGGMTLLEATRSVGLPIASACGENGACARCGLMILEGGENLEPETEREIRIKERNRIDPELRLACRIRPRNNLTVRATYW